MTKDEARRIYIWLTEPPKSLMDYSFSCTLSQIKEAAKILEEKIPSWIHGIEENEKAWRETSMSMQAIGAACAKEHDRIIRECLMEGDKL